MFSETRYARNGDLRVAYRASGEGERDIVFLPNWFTCCEVLPEVLPMQGWVEAMTSIGRLIFFDQPGTGASDPIAPGASPTLEQWTDSITAVLDELGSREAVLLAFDGTVATGALFAATYPTRTTALVVLEGYADSKTNVPRPDVPDESGAMGRGWVSALPESGHAVERRDPGVVGTHGTAGRKSRDRCADGAACDGNGCPRGASECAGSDARPSARGRCADCARDGQVRRRSHTRREVRRVAGRNMYHFVDPWRESFDVMYEFLTGHRPEADDDRVLATVLFTDIVDSTRMAATSATGIGARCSMRTTPSSGRNSPGFAAGG